MNTADHVLITYNPWGSCWSDEHGKRKGDQQTITRQIFLINWLGLLHLRYQNLIFTASTTILIFVGYYIDFLVPGFNRIARKCMWLRRSMMTRVGVNRPKMFAFSLISSFIKNTELLWKKTTIMFSLFY